MEIPEADPQPGALIPIETAAKMLQVSHWTLRYRVKHGLINCVRRDGRLLFSPTDLLRALQAKKKSE